MVDAGGIVLEILETRAFSAPKKNDLDTWVNTYKLTVTSLIDPASAPRATYDTYGTREIAFVVELSTMKVLKKYQGNTAPPSTSTPSSIDSAVTDILALLGK